MNMPRHIRAKAEPCGRACQKRLGRPLAHQAPRVIIAGDTARARFSARMRTARTAALSSVNISASQGEAEDERQQSDLAGDHGVIGMRQQPIGSTPDQGLARAE